MVIYYTASNLYAPIRKGVRISFGSQLAYLDLLIKGVSFEKNACDEEAMDY